MLFELKITSHNGRKSTDTFVFVVVVVGGGGGVILGCLYYSRDQGIIFKIMEILSKSVHWSCY